MSLGKPVGHLRDPHNSLPQPLSPGQTLPFFPATKSLPSSSSNLNDAKSTSLDAKIANSNSAFPACLPVSASSNPINCPFWVLLKLVSAELEISQGL